MHQRDVRTCYPCEYAPLHEGWRRPPFRGDVVRKPLLELLVLEPLRYHNLDPLAREDQEN